MSIGIHNYFRDRGYAQGISDSYSALRNGDTISVNNSFFKRIFRSIKKLMFDFLFLSKESRDALGMFSLGYREGYAFHQRCFRDDKSVQDWVLKDKYF